ncbi:MAG: glutamate racemase [Ruminococcaceae bacterium]|nr:glutamate racemase [Oscillospiraceae bacterium]
MDKRPIGVFDSGLGGLSTVRAMKKILPNEDIVYFGDTGRVPYGSRSNETIETYAAQDIKFLETFSCKMIVAACGTVSTTAAHVLDKLSEPATGITKPSAKAAAMATTNNIIGVMGTSATVNSNAFEAEIHKTNPEAKVVSVACPLLVSLVENNWIDIDDEVANATVKRYIKPIIEAGADTIILGCTHFPILAPIIQKVAGGYVKLIDTGYEEAMYVKDVLRKNNLENESTHIGSRKYYVSDKTQNFCSVANILLGEDIESKCEFIDIFKYI